MRWLPDNIIEQYGTKDGPLPKFPAGNVIAARFWVFYQNPETPKNLMGVRTSVAYRAAKAGIARSKAEPGIDPKTDPRAKRD